MTTDAIAAIKIVKAKLLINIFENISPNIPKIKATDKPYVVPIKLSSKMLSVENIKIHPNNM
jgi:hypothetical protein